MNTFKSLVLSVVSAVCAVSGVGAYDGTLRASDWGSNASWAAGEVVDGAGKSVYSIWQSVGMPTSGTETYRDITVGSLTFGGLSATQYKGMSANLVDSRTFGSLIFDSGDSSVSSTLVFEQQLNAKSEKTAQVFDLATDLLLKSDLLISSQSDNIGSFIGQNESFLWMTGNIRDDGAGKGLAFSNTVAGMSVRLQGDNDFTGDVDIMNGRVLLGSRDRATGPATQLGHDNTIRVSAGSQLDIANFSFGADQNFEIAGMGYNFETDYNGTARPGTGAIAVSGQNRTDHPTIAGTITLKADAGIGNGHVKSGNGFLGGNPVDITGKVTDEGKGHSLVLLGKNAVTLTNPENSFKSLLVSNGLVRATSAAALGTKNVVLCNSIWRWDYYEYEKLSGGLALVPGFDITDPEYAISLSVDAATWSNPAAPYKSLNLSTADGDVAFAHPLKVKAAVDGNPLPSVVKFGPDRLTLTGAGEHGDIYVYNGGLTLDYSNDTVPATVPAAKVACGNADIRFVGGSTAYDTQMAVGMTGEGVYAAATYTFEGAAGSHVKASFSVSPYSVIDMHVADGVDVAMSASYLNNNILNPWFIWNGGEAFCMSRGYSWEAKQKGIVAFDKAETAWTTDTSVADTNVPHVDVAGEIPTTVPDGARAATIRFCDPAVRSLTLEGHLGVVLSETSGYGWGRGGGAILVTPGMGEGDITISGGEISISGTPTNNDRNLYIHQWNTNATLTISSDIVNPANGKKLNIIKTGPGKVVFSGRVQATGDWIFLGGEVAFASPSVWPTDVTPTNLRMLNTRWTLAGGDYGSRTVQAYLHGGTSVFDLPTADCRLDVIGGKQWQVSPGVRLVKTGAGTLSYSNAYFAPAMQDLPITGELEFDVDGGTLGLPTTGTFCGVTAFSRTKTRFNCRNNSVIKSPRALHGEAYMYIPEFWRQAVQFNIEGDETTGAIFDLDGASLPLGYKYGNNIQILHDPFTGNGRLTITNTSATAATFQFAGMFAPSFTGILDAGSYLTCFNRAGGIPNGVLHLNGSAVAYPKSNSLIYAPRLHEYVALGGISGRGSVDVVLERGQAQFVFGRDADETLVFNGPWLSTPWTVFNPTMTYVKRGSNTQSFACPTNTFSLGWQVRGGRLLAAGGGKVAAEPTTVTSPKWGGRSTAYGVDYALIPERRGAVDGNDTSKGVNAFADNTSGFTMTGVSAENPLWCTYQFAYPQRINVIGLRCHSAANYPAQLIVSGSDDNVSWTDLLVVNSPKVSTYGDWWYYAKFSNATAWKYYKFTIPAAQADRADADVSVREFGLFCQSDASGSMGSAAISIGNGADVAHDYISSSLASAGASAGYLAGAPVTNGNAIVFGTAAPVAEIGTAHASGTSIFTSDLDLTRDVTFHAEGQSKAVFTGHVTGSGAVLFSGTGTVLFEAPVTTESTTWAFADPLPVVFNGGLTVPAGMTIDVSGVIDQIERGQRYEILKTPGGLTGAFTVTGVPEGYSARWRNNVLTVRKNDGFVLVVR